MGYLPGAHEASLRNEERARAAAKARHEAMNTNESQAKYDAIKRHGVDIPGIGTVANLADVQRDVEQAKEREPMLSDEGIEDIIPMPTQEDFQWMVHGGKMIRDHYESLITTGKLRVVEEVAEDDPFDHVYRCSGMHVFGPSMECVKFCPGCGNKIKR